MPSHEREARPVQVQHVALAEPPPGGGGPDSPDRNSFTNIPQPVSFNGSAGMYGLAPAPRGVGFLTLLAGLVAAVGLSAYISTRLIAKEFKKASASFVDKKALADATAGQTDFQDKTKTHVTALEAEIKKLTDELAASKAAVESSKVAAASAPAAAKEAATAAKSAKGAKSAETKAAEAKTAKGKKSLAAAKSKSSSLTAMSKAAARGAALRKKSARAAPPESGDETGGISESAASASSSDSESPSVPNPPGLDDLPPPPAE
jgi:septal ring factor EnvC (AmiA/AmiB activator)